jgi:hypothetical protein
MIRALQRTMSLRKLRLVYYILMPRGPAGLLKPCEDDLALRAIEFVSLARVVAGIRRAISVFYPRARAVVAGIIFDKQSRNAREAAMLNFEGFIIKK